jgi:5,10-methenyltetrahydromethanopterin hydrogenase
MVVVLVASGVVIAAVDVDRVGGNADIIVTWCFGVDEDDDFFDKGLEEVDDGIVVVMAGDLLMETK